MNRESVDSSNLRAVGYDPDEKVLEVEFQGGDVYTYRGVEPDLYDDLMRADSKGAFFQERIRDNYPFHREGRD
jgi:hypothetical protein